VFAALLLTLIGFGMDWHLLNIAVSVLCAIILFMYGLKAFSLEIEDLASEQLKSWLERVTKNRWRGFLIGAGFTAVIQSSSAVSSMTIALVNSQVLSFQNSLAILFGTNVGTTATAWLVSFDLQSFGPLFIVLGWILGVSPVRIRLLGKAIFYFGFIFFSLNLINSALAQVKDDPMLLTWIQAVDGWGEGIVVGLVITALVQSSSVVTGLCILLVSQGILSTEAAIAMVIGANAGTTSTALLASIDFEQTARMGAVANFIFNLTGSLLFLPLVGVLTQFVQSIMEAPAQQLALAHLIFNLVTSLLFLLLLSPFHRLLLWLMRPKGREAA
jgi:phosphate:Na+ symporter